MSNDNTDQWAGVLRRGMLSLGGFVLVLVVIMFLPAGIGWWQGWLFLVIFVLQMALAVPYLWHRNPAIFVARSKIHRATKTWDKVVMCFLLLSLMTTFPVAGLDARCHGSSVPVWLVVVGYLLLTVGMLGSVWAEGVNKFAEPGVRIQRERGHKVVDTGPYAFVRHPMYDAAFFLFAGIALALGSYWALIPAVFVAVILIVRTALEDRFLHEELEGYREYAQRVRYRLIPGVW